MFVSLDAADRLTGKDQFLCCYLKNTAAERILNFYFWLSSTKPVNKTLVKWGLGSAGKNGTEQAIATINQSPSGVTWRDVGVVSSTPLVTEFASNNTLPIWLWWHCDAVTSADTKWVVEDDLASFNWKGNIDSTGTGSPGTPPIDDAGGGSGGNPPVTITNYKIAISGDWGCETETDDIVQLIRDQGYNYVVGVGDNAYASASCWVNRFTVLKPNFNSAYGNHEYSESGGTTPYKTFFGHSLTYFNFTYQNIRFIVMDTNLDIDNGSAQYAKVVQWLTEANQDGTIDWIFVIMHHPWWISSSQHPADEFDQIETYQQLFINHKVDFVCAGHNHNLQRTFQLGYNASNPVNAPTIVDNTSPYVSGGGIIHVVSGAGGHDHPGTLYDLPSQPSHQAYQSNAYNGIWEVIASNNGKTLTCQFRDLDENVFDTFQINK